MKEGFITKVNAGIYDVLADDVIYQCKPRGKFRKDKISPIAGDNVTFDENEKYILSIKERKNSFVRPQVCNVDQVIVVASLRNPDVSLGLINRFITMCLLSNVKPVIALSKMDLLEDKQIAYDIKEKYKLLGFDVIPFSSFTGEGMEDIISLLHGKKSAFTGQSGVGKSSLINALLPDQNRETGEISKALGRGRHVTRVVEFVKYQDGFIIDTPGFSLIDFKITPEVLAQTYPGFENLFSNCKFRGCLHDHEPGCYVKEKLKDGHITQEHYDIYISLLNEIKEYNNRKY